VKDLLKENADLIGIWKLKERPKTGVQQQRQQQQPADSRANKDPLKDAPRMSVYISHAAGFHNRLWR
jgi:hypothetical protein